MPGITPHARGGFRVEASAGSGADRVRLVRVVRGDHDAAVAMLAELRAELDHAVAVDHAESLVALCRRYVADRARLGRAPSYVAEMARKCDLLATTPLGATPAPEVTADHLQAFYARLDRDGLGASGVRAWHALISGALSAGVRWQLLGHNVAKVGQLAPPEPRPKGLAPDPALARRYLAAVEAAHPTLAALLRTAALTGARRGEACGLRWPDVDAEHAVLNIRPEGNLTSPKGRRYAEGPTKNHEGRAVPLSPEALGELLSHRARCEVLAELAGVEILVDGFIFGPDRWPDGSVPFRPDYVSRRSREIAEDAKLPTRSCHPHGLRHYYATQGLASGADVAAMADNLGHDATVMLDVYAHGVNEAKVAAAAAVGRTLAR